MESLKVLNAIAPIKSIKFTNRPKHSWFNKFIREQNRVVKNCERSWIQYKQQHQWQTYMKERNVYNRSLIYHKKQTISKKINESRNDTKPQFYLINSITMSNSLNPMSEGKMDAQLAEEFASFFLEKVEDIRLQFQNADEYIPEVNTSVLRLQHLLPMTYKEIEREILSMKNKTCELDTIPTNLLRDILLTVLKIITQIVNMSLTTSTFPLYWKKAIIRPLIKGPD